jgi:tetratricopeptide (TPR) repeat protein
MDGPKKPGNAPGDKPLSNAAQGFLNAAQLRAGKSASGPTHPPATGQAPMATSKSRMAPAPPHGDIDPNASLGRRTLGRKIASPNLAPTMKKAFIVITIVVLSLAALILLIAVQFKTGGSLAGKSTVESANIHWPKGKKPGTPAVHQTIARLAAQAAEDGNNKAAAHLYGHAAEEARLAGAPMAKQYIDALLLQGEIYLNDLSDPDNGRLIFERALKAELADTTTKPIKLAQTYDDLARALDQSPSDPDGSLYKDKIIVNYQKAVSIAKGANDTEGLSHYAYDAGDYYLAQTQYDKALALGRDSMAAFAKIKEADTNELARCHYLIGSCLAHMAGQTHFEQADKEFNLAVDDFEKTDPRDSAFPDCLREAAWNKLRLGERSEASELFKKASQNGSAEDDETGDDRSADGYMHEALK